MTQISKKQIAGIAWFMAHCLFFSIMSVISKKLVATVNVFEVLFFQTGIGTLVMLPIMFMHHKHQWRVRSYKIHMLRALCWALASALFFYSVTIISVPRAIAVSFAVPLFTTVMAVIFLKEELHRHRTISLIAGFVGMLIIIQPGMEGFESVTLLVVLAAFLWSITDIIIKLLSKEHHAFVSTFYFGLFAAVCVAPVALYFWKTPTLVELGLMLSLAGLFVVNIYSVSKAYENADLTIMMPFAFSQLIFVAVLSYIFLGQVMAVATGIGSLVIIVSTSYIAYREKKRHGEFMAVKLGEELNEELIDGK